MRTKKRLEGVLSLLINLGKYLFVPLSLGWLTWKHMPVNTNVIQQASTLASVTATLLGFIIAAVAVIVSINNETLVNNLKKYGYYENLIRSMMYSGLFMLLTTLTAFGVGFLPGKWQAEGISLSIILATIAFTLFVSAARKLWLVLSNLADDQE